MRTFIVFVLLAVCFTFASGCAYQRSPVMNMADLSRFDFSNASSLKESRACATYVFGLGPFGNPSVMDAIKDGGIKTVKVVDYRQGWYLIVSKDCVVVYGD